MITCGPYMKPALILIASKSPMGIGRKVVLAKVGVMGVSVPAPDPRKPEDIKWCDECGRYYNPKSEHECISNKVKSNQRSLERWLGRYKIREDGK